MSWFARSIASTFKLDDENDQNQNHKHQQQADDDNSPQSPRQGVKEDLTEITKTLTRQFWGVASLLSNDPSETSDPSDAISGIRRDLAEIGGKFRGGFSKLSNKIDVSEITKLASDLLQSESEDDDDNDSTDDVVVVGVTEDVVAFASDIAVHPETWLNFPLPRDNNEDFDMSDVQQEHVMAVERLAPSLGALRIELCPRYMNESLFWKIYFVLLHPRLESHVAQFLSTPNILKARALLTHELKNRSYYENASNSKSESTQLEASTIETVKHPIYSDEIQIVDTSAIEAVEHPTHSDEILIVDKSVIKEDSLEVDDENDWLKEENSEIVIDRVTVPIENLEDVSFSDFEDDDDDDGNIPIHYKKVT